MVDIASLVLRSFQDMVVGAFGEPIGWAVGHTILLLLILSIIWIIRNRNRILMESGWSFSTLQDVSVILILTGIQYIIYVNLLEFPETASLGLGLFVTMSLRWHILVLE